MSDPIADLRAAIGDPALMLETPEETGAYTTDWTKKFVGTTPMVLRPRTTADVSRMLTACNALGIKVVPQGGNTGVVGGSTPRSGEVVLSLSRLNTIADCDPASATVVVGAGVVLAALHDFAAPLGMEFPIDLGARGQCQIGGMLATNAGGNRVLRYGLMREQVRGLEVVLADGTVVSNLNRLRKDNSGLDLKQLFVGAEGILGVITQAVLQVRPCPPARRTAMLAMTDRAALPALLAELRARLPGLSSLEVLLDDVCQYVCDQVPGASMPFAERSPVYALVEEETETGAAGHDGFVERLSGLFESGLAADAVVAESEAQSAGLWHVREATGEAIVAAGYSHKFDITVPQGEIPEFLDEMEALAATLPGIKPLLFGHLGDGNVHANFVQTPEIADEPFLAEGPALAKAVYDATRARHGSVSAEHGIGTLKRDYLGYSKSPEEISLMRRFKGLLDPNGILNPGVMLD